MYKLFYCFYGEASGQNEVTAEEPIDLEAPADISELISRLVTDGDFLGLIDDDGNVLQAMYEQDKHRFWLEIPVPAQSGSYGKHCSLADLRQVFANLPPHIDVAAFPDFRFESW